MKLQAFGDTETAPRPDHLAAEISARRAELALTGHQLGLLDGKPVAVLAYYRGAPDQLVFNLGTRVPYRHRGIAQAMLARWVDAGVASGCRSLIINAEDGGACRAVPQARVRRRDLLVPEVRPQDGSAGQKPTTCRISTMWMRPGSSWWISSTLPTELCWP